MFIGAVKGDGAKKKSRGRMGKYGVEDPLCMLFSKVWRKQKGWEREVAGKPFPENCAEEFADKI